MTMINDVPSSWSEPVTLTNDEIWQVREGKVYITTTSNPSPDDGFVLLEGEGVLIRANKTVRYRRHASLSTGASLVREEV